MDLKTDYLGLELAHPLMLGASPLSENLDAVRRAEDAGAAAIVLRSLFEEQVTLQRVTRGHVANVGERALNEAPHYLAAVAAFTQGPDEYLEQLRLIKAAVSIPVVASLNGVTNDGWVEFAGLIDRAGADALELNLYAIGSDPRESAAEIEQRLVDVVRAVRAHTRLPLAAKLSPTFSSIAHFAAQLECVGGLAARGRHLPDPPRRAQRVDGTAGLSRRRAVSRLAEPRALLEPQRLRAGKPPASAQRLAPTLARPRARSLVTAGSRLRTPRRPRSEPSGRAPGRGSWARPRTPEACTGSSVR